MPRRRRQEKEDAEAEMEDVPHEEENLEDEHVPDVNAEHVDEDGLLYDPDQDQEERRAIRKSYRSLQDDEALQNVKDVGIDLLTQKVEKANKLFKRVRAPQEATLDSAFLLTASNLGAAKARQMRADIGGFDVDDFVAKLITFMGGRRQAEGAPNQRREDEDDYDAELDDEGDSPLDWEKIGRKALAKSRRVPAMEFMLGPLSVEQKKRNIVKRSKLEKSKEEEKRPQELNEQDIQKSENETTKNVVALGKLLEQTGEINLFKLIVNPESFGQSVENLFYLSFLIRDGKVALDMRDEGPIIFLCDPPTDEDYAEGVRKKQMIMELDMDTWRRAIEIFDITEARIPTRKAAQTRIGSQWYG